MESAGICRTWGSGAGGGARPTLIHSRGSSFTIDAP